MSELLMLIGERVVHLRGTDRWPSLRAERRPMAHAVAGGLVLDLVLGEGVWRTQRGRLVVTGPQPSDAILADTIEGWPTGGGHCAWMASSATSVPPRGAV